MVKFFLKDSDQEVFLGNTITVDAPISTPYGNQQVKFKVEITSDNLEQLVKDGLIVVKEVNINENKNNKEFTYYKDLPNLYRKIVKKTSKILKTDFNNAYTFLSLIKEVSPRSFETLIADLAISFVSNDMDLKDAAIEIWQCIEWTKENVK